MAEANENADPVSQQLGEVKQAVENLAKQHAETTNSLGMLMAQAAQANAQAIQGLTQTIQQFAAQMGQRIPVTVRDGFRDGRASGQQAVVNGPLYMAGVAAGVPVGVVQGTGKVIGGALSDWLHWKKFGDVGGSRGWQRPKVWPQEGETAEQAFVRVYGPEPQQA